MRKSKKRALASGCPGSLSWQPEDKFWDCLRENCHHGNSDKGNSNAPFTIVNFMLPNHWFCNLIREVEKTTMFSLNPKLLFR